MTQPTLHQLIKRQLRNRITIALGTLVACVILVSVAEAGLSFADLKTKLDERARELQDQVISEILVNNQISIHAIIEDSNRRHLDEPVTWDPSGSPEPSNRIKWAPPATWTYQVPLRQIGGQRFGSFEFRGSFLTSGDLPSLLTHRVALVLLICIGMAITLYPIASKIPNDLILTPVRDLLRVLRSESPTAQYQSSSTFAEIDEIMRDMIQVMNEKRRLEDERVEMQRMMTVTQTAQMIAHDMRKPFGLLRMVLDGLASADNAEDVRELTATALPGLKRSVAQLDAMLNELVSVGADAGIRAGNVDLREPIENAVQAAIAVYGSTGVSTTFDFTHEHSVSGDASQIERVISNIVQNALQAMGSTGQMRIATRSLSNGEVSYVEASIANSGSYIPAEDVRKVFDLFYTSGKTGGTGLGLAIAQKIIRNHRGNIWCESDEKSGTKFYFRIPASGKLESPASREPLTPPYPASESRLDSVPENVTLSDVPAERALTILIADDERVYRDSLVQHVNSSGALGGKIRVIDVATTDEAIRLGIDASPDLIFLDVDFLDGSARNGFDVAMDLRRRGCRAEICFHSNHPVEEVRRRSAECGAGYFLAKPVTRGHLDAVMIAALGPDRSARTEHISSRGGTS